MPEVATFPSCLAELGWSARSGVTGRGVRREEDEVRGLGVAWIVLAGCIQAEAGTLADGTGASWAEPAAVPLGALAGEAADPGGRMATSSSHPDCGDTITRDTKLRRDIGPCPGDGLIIADDDVELDCDGHRILGTGGGDGVSGADVDDIEVEDCVIEDFENGIRFERVDGGEIEDNEISTGWEPPDVPPNCILIQDSEDLDVEDNQLSRCRGAEISATEDLVVEDNEVEDCEIGFLAFVSDSRFEDNEVEDCTGEGFDFENTFDSVIEGNEVEDVGTGMLISGSDGNRFEDNEVEDADGIGFFILGSNDNEFAGNEANDNEFGFYLQGSDDNTFEDNEANDNDEVGFNLVLDSDDNELEDNEACDNGDVDLFVSADSDGNDFDDNNFCEVELED